MEIVDDDFDKHINDYYAVNKERALKYSKEYYKRPGIKEKRSKYNKEYYRKKRKYVVCNKCKIPILEHNFLLLVFLQFGQTTLVSGSLTIFSN